jgi:hypothetical protein
MDSAEVVTIKRTVRAQQWLGEGHPLPADSHLCRPEVHWSADRKLIYFTYAELMPRHWMTAIKEHEVPKEQFAGSYVKITEADATEYYRTALPFSFWSVKSEASLRRDWRAVYFERDDADMVRLFLDFCHIENWTNPLPPRAEHRRVDGSCGRGYSPTYLKPGDWLVRERDDKLGQDRASAMSDADFQMMRSSDG